MIRKVFFICFLLFSMGGQAQTDFSDKDRALMKSLGIRTREQWDYKYVGDRLSIKGMCSSRITFDREGRALEVINYKSDTAILNITLYTYNAKGLRTDMVKYLGNKISILFRVGTIYDSKGNKTTENGFNGTENFTNRYSYDGAGRLAKIQYYIGRRLDETRDFSYNGDKMDVRVSDGSGNLLYTLVSRKDAGGRVIEESKLDKDRKETEHTVNNYDSRGNLVQVDKVTLNRRWSKTFYIYDNLGNVSEVYSEEAQNPKYLKQSYSYTNNGLLTGEFWRTTPNSDQSYKKYTYDHSGKLISTDCFYASYKYKVLNKFVYQTY